MVSLVCLAHLEGAAGSRFVAPALLCSAMTELFCYFLPSGLNPWENLATSNSFHEQSSHFSSKQLEGQQNHPKQYLKSFSHFPLQFSVGFIAPKRCCLTQDWIFGCFFLCPLPGCSHAGSGARCLMPAGYPGIPGGRRVGEKGSEEKDTHLPEPGTHPQ